MQGNSREVLQIAAGTAAKAMHNCNFSSANLRPSLAGGQLRPLASGDHPLKKKEEASGDQLITDHYSVDLVGGRKIYSNYSFISLCSVFP